MKKVFIYKNNIKFSFICLCLVIIFTSCSGAKKSVKIDGSGTVRYKAIKKSQSCNWLDMYEEEEENPIIDESEVLNVALDSIVKSEDVLNSVIKIDLEEYAKKSHGGPIFPSITGFGSLDISTISEDLLKQVKLFLEYTKKGDFSDLKTLPQKNYLRALAEYRLNDCSFFTESFIGKLLQNSKETDFMTIPVFIQKDTSQYVLILYYTISEKNIWFLDTFKIYNLDKKMTKIEPENIQ